MNFDDDPNLAPDNEPRPTESTADLPNETVESIIAYYSDEEVMAAGLQDLMERIDALDDELLGPEVAPPAPGGIHICPPTDDEIIRAARMEADRIIVRAHQDESQIRRRIEAHIKGLEREQEEHRQKMERIADEALARAARMIREARQAADQIKRTAREEADAIHQRALPEPRSATVAPPSRALLEFVRMVAACNTPAGEAFMRTCSTTDQSRSYLPANRSLETLLNYVSSPTEPQSEDWRPIKFSKTLKRRLDEMKILDVDSAAIFAITSVMAQAAFNTSRAAYILISLDDKIDSLSEPTFPPAGRHARKDDHHEPNEPEVVSTNTWLISQANNGEVIMGELDLPDEHPTGARVAIPKTQLTEAIEVLASSA